MYSPKIPERLIPALYRLARARRQPMTRLVADALELHLITQGVALTDQQDDEDRQRATDRTRRGVA